MQGLRARLPHLTVFEHSPLPIGEGNGLTNAEAEYLTSLCKMRPGFCERGHRSVRFGQYCGVISLGERMLEVLPKVEARAATDESRDVLLRLLRHAGVLPTRRLDTAGQHFRRAALLDVFIAAFFDTVTDIIRGGILRQYTLRREDLSVVRGSVDSARQFGVLFNRSDRVACQYDDLSADNRWNQIVKLGLRIIRPWITGLDLSRRWVEITSAFDEVSDVRADVREIDRLVFDRQGLRYQPATKWVRWILALLSPAVRAGPNEAPGLLFDMNVLFESAVSNVLRKRAIESDFDIQTQDSGRNLATVRGSGRDAFPLRPDLVTRRRGVVTEIGDTKWKKLEVSATKHLKPKREDVYQMLAYAAAYQCERLTLFYPWHGDLASSLSTVFELPMSNGRTPVVTIVCIDVHNDLLPIVQMPNRTGRVT
jgi:5-methylcytosine-specific restriction enzyme subunit McrC